MRGKSTAPKDALVNIIINNLSGQHIRNGLNLGDNANIVSQVNNQKKSVLVDLLKSTVEGAHLLAKLEDKYPLSGVPTLYLVISRNLAPAEKILEVTDKVANNDECQLSFSSHKTIRHVYSTERAKTLNLENDFIEIPVFYERRIDYTSTDPDTWGENYSIFDLRRAFIWVSHAYNHGLIACSDYSAINPIKTWANIYLNLQLDLPNISIDLFQRLAKGGTPRTATFAAIEMAGNSFLDIQSLTIFDQELEICDTYNQLVNDDDREQTAGYFSRHPAIPIGGLGIARRYGRIWTPNHLPKDQLLISAVDLISRTEAALSEKLNTNDKSFVDHFGNITILINNKVITKEPRKVFDDIAWKLFQLTKRNSPDIQIDNDLVTKIIAHKDTLGFTTTIEAECDQCGSVLYKCPICSTPCEAVVQNDELVIVCPYHKDQTCNNNDEGYACECGQDIQVILPNNIKIYPGLSTISAFRDFVSQNDLRYAGWFVIDGNLIRSYAKPRNPSNEYHLCELNKWRLRAHIHVPGPLSDKQQKLIKDALKDIKEKCNKNDWHPKQAMCDECRGHEISINNINNGNMCLPRLMGLAIEENFDGIHHGYEGADIKYRDNLFNENNREISIGIHLKSRDKKPPNRGVGQASPGIKGLYAQLFFTVHKKLRGNREFDLIGVSIPNKIFQETREAFTGITTELGVPILIIDEENWISITAAAFDHIENLHK